MRKANEAVKSAPQRSRVRTFKLLGRLLSYLFHYYKGRMIAVFVCIAITAAAGISSTFFMGLVLDNVINPLAGIGPDGNPITPAVWGDVSQNLLFIIGGMSGEKQVSSRKTDEKSDMSIVKFLFSPRIISYFLFIVFPYVICASFLSYFFPIFGEESGLTETHISFAFLVSGVISIYVGPTIAELAARKLGVKKSMILSSVIYAAALVLFLISPTILGCFIVIAMFAFADGIGLTAQSVYYSGLPEVERLGNGKAMSIETTVENISSTCGPIIFGFVLMVGARTGMTIVGGIFAAFLVLFVIVSAVTGRKKTDTAA